MTRRILIITGLLIAVIIGVYAAFLLSGPVPLGEPYADSATYTLLFRPGILLILIAAFLGMLFRASSKRSRPGTSCTNGKILRHDVRMFLSHWTIALSMIMMAVTGIMLGPLFLPRLVHTPEAIGFVLNVHFVGIVIFAFGLVYYISDMIIDGGVKELLPGARDVREAFSYYTSKLTGAEAPQQGKFLASEKLAYPVWIVLVAGIIITGGIKIVAHLWSMSGALMGVTTLLHGIFTLAIVVMLVLHVVLGSIVPWSWPLLRSMITGYVSEEYAQKHHGRWYKEIQKI